MVIAAGKITGIVDARNTTKEELGLLMTKNTSILEDIEANTDGSQINSEKEETDNG